MKKEADSKTGRINPEDAALFRASVGEVKLLAETDRVAPQVVARKPVLRRADKDQQTSATRPGGSPADILSDFVPEIIADDYLANGLSRMTLRKLRRGTWPVQDSLDLHGNTSDASRKLLQQFLQQATNRGLRCVLVIHGKGLNSQDGEGILRKLTRHWLAQHMQVLAFCNAQPRDGGSGAAVVLLKAAS
ncbi:MAG: Smr/MutS family protein [Gallionella sp.]|nr:Smr/MutS family protein [Gallionella sp.]